jgi:hypothetical protein
MTENRIIDVEPSVVIGNFRYYSHEAKRMFKALFAVEPIIINFIALFLCAGILYVATSKDFMPDIGKYHKYIFHFIQFLACYQIVLSAKKSLLLPVSTLIISIGAIVLFKNSGDYLIPITILREMVLLGVLGTAVSIFHMR